MSIIDRVFLAEKTSKHIIKHISQSICVYNIDDAIVSFFEYIYLELVFYRILKNCFVVGKFCRQIYIVDNFKTNIFIDFDILDSKKIVFNFVFEFLTIDSYRDIIVSIKVISLREKIYKTIRAYSATVVSSYSNIIVSICLRDKYKIELSNNCNLIFISIKLSNRFESNSDVLNYITNANICAI